MSAAGITDVLCGAIAKKSHDFMLCNFANADMVGHTGVLPAVIKAVETVDQCLDRVLTTATPSATVLVTADHGNCELMIDRDRWSPYRSHHESRAFVAVRAGNNPLRSGAPCAMSDRPCSASSASNNP
jgi:2,3-bisphosphoglycerate-independent phosphoglycerate mutase